MHGNSLLKSKRFTIGSDEYRVTQLGALRGRKLFLRIMHTIVVPMKEVAKGGQKISESALATMLAGVIDSLDEETFELLCNELGDSCEVRQGEAWPKLTDVVFDLHFAGDYVKMGRWLWECLAFNFFGFLGDTSLGKMTDLAQRVMVGSKRESPTESTGS